jgi:tRNA(Ile)-lysidine synthase
MAESAALPLTLPDAAPLLGPYLFQSESKAAKGIVLAVSGGPDSVALMRIAAGLRTLAPARPMLVATVDHGLRSGSRAEAEQVAVWAEAVGLPHRILTWAGAKPKTRVQEVARTMRYNLLFGLAREIGASSVLTGHTLDDQAETVLMRMGRGTGVAGLAGMRPRRERNGMTLARPFLSLRKSRLVATCQAEGWPFLDDPSNADPRFARARLRRLTPLMERAGLTPERLGLLAARARRAEDALEARIATVMTAACVTAGEGRIEIDGTVLRSEPDAIVLGVVTRAIVGVAGALTRPVRLERFEARILGDLRAALDRGGALRMTLGGALIDICPGGRLVLTPEPPRRRSADREC